MEKHFTYQGREISYTLEYKRVKNINLRVRRDGSVYVSAPEKVPFSQIEAFVISKAPLITKAADRLKNTAPEYDPLKSGECFFLGQRYKFCLSPGNTRISGDTLYSPGMDSFEKWERRQATKIITSLCTEKYPLFTGCCKIFPEIRFRKMISKWGVCRPSEHLITFNTHLVRQPVPFIEYVICHEFVHFKHPNHSKHFYTELSRIMPDWKQRRSSAV